MTTDGNIDIEEEMESTGENDRADMSIIIKHCWAMLTHSLPSDEFRYEL